MVSTAVSVAGWVAAGLAGVLAVSVLRAYGDRMEAVARACHELRGPLTAARLGLAAPAGQELPSPGRLRAIDTELGRAALALDDLSGTGGGPRRLWRLDRVDVRGLVTDCVEAWQASAAVAARTVQVGWSGAEAAVWGDRLRLAQALGNLLANAIEHGRGPVLMRGRRAGHVVRFEVCDQGGGLPAPVAQLTRGARAGRGRRGRGLAIAAAIAAAHGGRLAGAPAQQGARLVLELPVSGSLSRVAAPWQPPVPEIGAGCSDHSTVGTGRRKVRLWRRASWSVVTARSLDSAGTPRSPNRGSAAIWSSRPR
jgi:signal transduction histidine kinase